MSAVAFTTVDGKRVTCAACYLYGSNHGGKHKRGAIVWETPKADDQ